MNGNMQRKRRENDPAYKEKQQAASEGVASEEPGVMIRIGMRMIRNTRKVGRRHVGNGMRMILSIGHSRNSVVREFARG